MERDEFSQLPGGVFRKAYIRSVATEVRLDAEELASEYDAQFGPDGASALHGLYETVRNRRGVATWLALTAACLALLWAGFMLKPASLSQTGEQELKILNDIRSNPLTAGATPTSERAEELGAEPGATPAADQSGSAVSRRSPDPSSSPAME
jgi:cytoskeletal protein RodZ